MSANSSSTSDDSLLHSNLTCVTSYLPSSIDCYISAPGSIIFTTFAIANTLYLLPICLFILYLGLQRWRHRRSTSSLAPLMSHSDHFTYHMVTMELFGILGYMVFCFGIYWAQGDVIFAGYCLCSFTWYGEMCFHCLTCVERYLAVVHPITYLSLRGESGSRVRSITIGCVWVLSCGGTSLLYFEETSVIVDFTLLVSSLTVTFICSLAVLCVLIRPGPGDKGGDREDRVDRSKRKAFYTIAVILGVLVMRFSWSLVWAVPSAVGQSPDCATLVSGVWFNLPSSLVLPLLYLLREGKLVCCKKNTNG